MSSLSSKLAHAFTFRFLFGYFIVNTCFGVLSLASQVRSILPYIHQFCRCHECQVANILSRLQSASDVPIIPLLSTRIYWCEVRKECIPSRLAASSEAYGK